MDGFRAAIEECSLCDLGYSGSKFTWTNGRDRADFTKERLDCALANQEWCLMF
jgi:hypothetical protein